MTQADQHRDSRKAHWDSYALGRERTADWSSYYHKRLTEVYRNVVSPGQRVLEIGCGFGDLLAAMKPSHGVGIDFSPEMVRIARQRHADMTFIEADAHGFHLDEKFDVIILSDLVNDLWDVQAVFANLAHLCTPQTRIICNFYSRLWQGPLSGAKRMGLARPTLDQNWLTVEDTTNLLYLAGFEVLKGFSEILWPLATPVVAPLCNRYLVKVWPFRWMAFTNVVVARLRPGYQEDGGRVRPPYGDSVPSVSVIVPARNEAGNIAALLDRVPSMGSKTEIIFVEGHSTDNTFQAIQDAIASHPGVCCKAMQQTGKGKADAVRLGFSAATCDILMILDADLTVVPEDLPRFYEAIASGKADFANGVRLVYPMEGQAMRFANLIGNKFFSLAFSWLIGQPIKDSLCGTKVMRRSDYERIAANRAYFGDFDPFGDFDLLFGAARLNLKIADIPVRYRQRTYGSTNIHRWRHGMILLKMVLFGAKRLKFV